MHLQIDPSDGIPLYLQIVTQVKYLVAAGRLAPGEEVPPIRKLVERLIVNPTTVARAYRELERDGVLVSRQGSGTRVSASPSPLSHEAKLRILTERVRGVVVEASQLGVPLEDVLRLVKHVNADLTGSTKETKA